MLWQSSSSNNRLPLPPDIVVMGRIAAPFAVKGWVRLQVFTEYLDSLLDYPVWWIKQAGEWNRFTVVEGAPHGKGLIARLEGVDDREGALALRGAEVGVPRADLPEPGEDEYYWQDLIGMDVVTGSGVALGKIDDLMETGANDVLCVRGDRQRLIPFVAAVVQDVSIAERRVTVDWDPDY